MSQEQIFSDYSGGMNALAAVDKLDPKECLLAENVRLDETGNIQSAGAFTHQNTSAYSASAGTSAQNVHSLYWNPSLGGVAGVGQDVFSGPTLGSFVSALAGKNSKQQKMSFASAPNRVYFDVGSVGYWTDMTNILTVDWAPPSVVGGAGMTGPNNGTLTGNTAENFGFALGTQSILGIQFTVQATDTITLATGLTSTLTSQARLIVGGVTVGTSTSTVAVYAGAGVDQPYTANQSFVFGLANSLWGFSSITPAQINASNFGVAFSYSQSFHGVTESYSSPQSTIWQGAGGFIVGTGTTGTLTGTYTWKITFQAANGEESDASIASTSVVLSGQQGTITAIPVGDARTTSRNIYRRGNLLTSYYLVGSIPDNATTTYSDNLTDLAALTAGIILAGDVPGDFPNTRLGNTSVRFPVYHYDRVFWINQNQPNQFLWSKPLNGFAYPVVNLINVGDSKPIVRLISIFGELIIIKTDSIWRLTGTDETSFDLTQTPSAVGTDMPFTIVALPDKILFWNRWGAWVFNGYTSQPLTTKLDLWFKQDDRTGEELFGVNGFRPPEVTSTTVPLNFDAIGNSEKYYVAYAEAGQPANNALLTFDVKHGNITKRKPGQPLPLSLAIDPVTGFVYMGDNAGFVSLLDDWNGATGGGAAVNFDFQSGYVDLQRGSNKSLWALEFLLDTDGQSLTPSVYYDNGVSSETLAPISTIGVSRVVRPVEATNSRKMQNFSWRLNGSINPVNKNGSPQIQIIHIKALFDIRTGRARTGQ